MFEQEMMCTPCYPSDRDVEVNKAYADYVKDTDSYDEYMCTGSGIDGAMPANNFERNMINTNAIRVRKELVLKYGITSTEWEKARELHNYRAS